MPYISCQHRRQAMCAWCGQFGRGDDRRRRSQDAGSLTSCNIRLKSGFHHVQIDALSNVSNDRESLPCHIDLSQVFGPRACYILFIASAIPFHYLHTYQRNPNTRIRVNEEADLRSPGWDLKPYLCRPHNLRFYSRHNLICSSFPKLTTPSP
jgi:hypothetical protein